MFRAGVIVTSVTVLFCLTALALRADGLLRHPVRVATALVFALVLGLALLLE